MTEDNLIKQIKKLIEPLNEGQKRLEKTLENHGKQLESQGKDIKILKQDVKNLDLKIEIVNSNLKKTKSEIMTHITYLFENSATQKQVDNLEHRVKALESA